MRKVLVLCYSSYGHAEALAYPEPYGDRHVVPSEMIVESHCLTRPN
jgi:hypothetical protein